MSGLFDRLVQKAGPEAGASVLQSTVTPVDWGVAELDPAEDSLPEIPTPSSDPVDPMQPDRQQVAEDVPVLTNPVPDPPAMPEPMHASTPAEDKVIPSIQKEVLKTTERHIEHTETRQDVVQRETTHHHHDVTVKEVSPREPPRVTAPSQPAILQPAGPTAPEPARLTADGPTFHVTNERTTRGDGGRTVPSVRIDIGQITVKAASPVAQPAPPAEATAPAAAPSHRAANGSTLTAYLGWRR